ncbi:hypothetical protein PG990_006514 [Apiospora arundinis]
MVVKIFLTGATGYIGGDALSVLIQAHPDFEYTLLVRTQEKADKVKTQYPNATIILGDLNDSELLREQAAKADIVLHTADASDHEGAARAIAAGLAEGHSPARPGYWLHTGGTGILTYLDSEAGKLGEHSDTEFNDWAGVGELTSLPDSAFHRNVDKVVLEAASDGRVRTAIVCPPTIYGTGRGPVATRGRQAYELARLVLREGYAPVVGQGKARWNHIHVADLSEAFRLLVEQAVASISNDSAGNGVVQDNKDEDLWGARGYYFVESGEHVWGELSRAMTAKAFEMGLLATDKKPQDHPLDKDEALEVAGFEAVSWGWNSRGRAERLRKVLGWRPQMASLEASIPEILEYEKRRL